MNAIDLRTSKAIILENCSLNDAISGNANSVVRAEGQYNLLLRTTIKSRMDISNTTLLRNGNGNLQVIGCVFDGTGGNGLNGDTGPGGASTFVDTIFRNFAGNIWVDHEDGYAGHWVFINCVFDSNLSGVFFEMNTTAYGGGDQLRFVNCLFRNPHDGYVFRKSSVVMQNCAMYSEEESSNWSDPADPTVIIGNGNLILESDPFIDAEGGDYRLTGSAARLLRGGYPATLPGIDGLTRRQIGPFATASIAGRNGLRAGGIM